MGISGGPDMIQDGLVLALDASDRNSYPGSGTVWSDMSGNNNSGSLINGPTFNTGSGGSIVFDGTNDYAVWNISNLGLNVEGPYTIECTLRYNSTTGTINPITLTSTNQRAFQFGYISSSPIVWRYGGTTILTYTPPSGIYTMSCTVTTSLVNVYINGTLNNSTSTPNLQTGTLTHLLSSAYHDGVVILPNAFLNGNIYNIRLYNRLLSAVEVLQNYNALKSRFNL